MVQRDEGFWGVPESPQVRRAHSKGGETIAKGRAHTGWGNKDWNKEDWLRTVVPMERTRVYWSRIRKKEERNYSATKREGSALKETLIKCQAILKGAEITAILDHYALAFINTFSYIKTVLANMSLFYHSHPGLSITYWAGRVHNNADTLSWYLYWLPKSQDLVSEDYDPIVLKEEEEGIKDFYAKTEPLFWEDIKRVVSQHNLACLKELPSICEVYQICIQDDCAFAQDYDTATCFDTLVSVSTEEIACFSITYQEDPHFAKVMSELQKEHHPLNFPFPQYLFEDNSLIYFTGTKGDPRLGVPISLQTEIIDEAHNNGKEGAHARYTCTYNQIRATYYWPQMARSIEPYTESCNHCQKNKPRQHRKQGYLHPIPIPEKLFVVVSLDFIMDLPDSDRFNAILVIIDKLTCYATFIPCTTGIHKVDTAKLFWDHIWSHYGLHGQIISDWDAQWTGAFWDHLTSILGLKHALTMAHHPQADGQTEIMNQTLEIALQPHIDDLKSNWSNFLPAMAFSYNTSIHSYTKQTLAFLLCSFEPLWPSHLRTNVAQCIP